jgi:hypothetical protein
MSDLYVELTELEALQQRLGDVAAELSTCSGELGRTDATELGSRDLESACDDFYSSWGYGIGKLGDAAGVVAEELGEALRVYTEADAELANIVRGG